jgi:ketosteroid isomerase-like protein
MSQENMKVVRAFYEALAQRDRETIGRIIREHMAPDFQFEALLTGGSYKGAAGAWELLDDIQDTVNYVAEVQEAVDLDEHVLIVLRISGRGSLSGVPATQQIAVLWTFDGNRVLSGKSFASKAEALKAVGLRE